ncbi:5-dehydro-4-deoxyglucarate dehydratase [Halobacillus naozhouensis]|uniref:Probable 5-dehydro-4-deoxyglucarate dehydratase n=1 Tax=Halobacillus naozhouensis TaxID=554880 RepID=A0ABY8IZ10_9BACI|nr:5-dehydro-4-deoxyglucarate dehydratase [Halobacillus naozhouensis]WFT74438.1 5-dehydro-4-deoxyglucarate dehydratase [Halobacillus naozhouensis]
MNFERKSPTGILGFPVSPYDEEGNVDQHALTVNVEFLLEGGLEAIFVACGAGEFTSLSLKEYEKMVELTVSVVEGRVPVYTGVGGPLSEAVEKARLSEKLGAEGYLILPPYLIEGEQNGLYEYYKAIIRSTDLNAILYQRANAILDLPTLKKLVEFPQVVGLKDGAGDMERNVEFTQNIGNQIGWLNGMPMAEVTMPTYVPLGFDSYSSAISNYIPHVSRKFYEAVLNDDKEITNQLYEDVILPINSIRRQRKGYAVSLIKAGMEIMGLPVSNTVRPPIIPVEKDHYKQLEKILDETLNKYPLKSKMV